MNNIPKVAYFYWGNTVLPYLRYMSMYSFKKFNPDWKIKLYIPYKLTLKQTWTTNENKIELKTKDYMNDLIKNVNDISVEQFNMEDINFDNDLSEVIKSDIIRLYILYKFGGLWSDSDILYFKPLTHYFDYNNDKIAYFCYRRGGPTQENKKENGPLYHSIGFLMGALNNIYYKDLFENVGKYLNNELYQSVGSSYYNTNVNMNKKDIFNIDMNVVYPCRSPQIMFSESYKKLRYQIYNDTIGWHWYCGHPDCGNGQNNYTNETYKNYNTIISHLLKYINNDIESIEDNIENNNLNNIEMFKNKVKKNNSNKDMVVTKINNKKFGIFNKSIKK